MGYNIFVHIHFIGIGGIGVSALAKYHLSDGDTVSGSDLAPSEITTELARGGARIVVGTHSAFNIPPETDAVIYTAAAPKSNPELKEARRRKLNIRSYAEAVGDLTRQFKTVTVSGAHGKSTTTALVALVLEEGYCDPTVIIGTKVREFGDSNFRQGRGAHLVLEADEWDRSFLNYWPQIAVITNIDAEHLDTYKTVEGVEDAFVKYLAKVPRDGAIIANADDPRASRIVKKFRKKVVWYSQKDRAAAAVRNVLKVPGAHNVSNALAALTVGRTLGIAEPDILRAISRFRGTWRRFEFKGFFTPVRSPTSNSSNRGNGALIFSDYGHHPREISATLAAARERFPLRRVWCVFQPHQYQRLKHLWGDFLGAFDLADRVCLLPVYDVAGRETKSAKRAVNSVKLAHALQERGKNAWHAASFDHAKTFLHAELRRGDVVLTMGAGDIYLLTNQLTKGTSEV